MEANKYNKALELYASSLSAYVQELTILPDVKNKDAESENLKREAMNEFNAQMPE
jgi:hypothetical protein